MPETAPDKIWYYNGQKLTLTGIVAEEPDEREGFVKYIVAAENLLPSGRTVRGRVLLNASLYPKYGYGDRLEINCRLESPAAFDDFAYDRYLARFEIYSLCRRSQITRISNDAEGDKADPFGTAALSKIYDFKNRLRRTMNSGLPEPAAGLARGIVLGDQKAVGEDLREAFSRTGLSHVVAISGMNITILGALAMNLFLALGFWRRQSFFIAAAILIFYLALIGWPASALRAGLMGGLALWAAYLGRLNKIAGALVLAAAVMLVLNPRLARDDVGFQLSFFATLGLAFFYEPLDRVLENRGWRRPAFARQAFSLTFAAQSLALPVLIHNFSQLSLISPVSNLFAVWTLPFIMMAVLAALPLGLLLPAGSAIFFLPALILLRYLIGVTEIMAKAPLASIEASLPLWATAAYFFAAGWLAWHLAKRPRMW